MAYKGLLSNTYVTKRHLSMQMVENVFELSLHRFDIEYTPKEPSCSELGLDILQVRNG